MVVCVACATTRREHAATKLEPREPLRELTFQTGGTSLPVEGSWQRSQRSGDDLDLALVGRQEGATRLLELSRQGGETGALALRALPLAPDARAERGRACELLSEVRLEERPLVLGVVHRILSEAAPLHEALAPGADAACTAELQAVRDDDRATAAEKDLAESGLVSISALLDGP